MPCPLVSYYIHTVLHIHDLSKQYGSKILFEGAEAHVGQRSRVALIGPNGSGKSTFIRIVLGIESADSGQISRPSHLSIGYLAQEVPKFSGSNILTEVMRMDGRRAELIKARTELEDKLAKSNSADAADLERYGKILAELDHLDEYRLESRAKEILSGMGFHPKDFGRFLTEFSGGWLMRVALSRILLMDPDLLLLDEPTNHLDLESLLWLEEFLKSFKGAMLLISHDTAFLNRLVHEVLEIDQRRLWIYRGNLEDYSRQKEERLAVLRAQHRGQQAKVAEIEAFVNRFGAKATKARQAQSRLKQLEKMELIELPEDRPTVRFRFPPTPHGGREVVTVRDASVRFGEKIVFQNLNWVIQRGSRVAIVGVNGAGKTTLLKLLSGKPAASGGLIKHGHAVQIGYYAQLQAESLDLKKTVLQELEETAPDLPISQVRGIAGAFLFSGDSVEKKCGILSGGEKARVALAKLLLLPSNFLVLDEPTNHLDAESRKVLLNALSDYKGTLCLVSHDRDFMGPLVNSVLEIVPSENPSQGSRVNHLLGNYEDYLEKKLREAFEKPTSSGAKPAGVKPSSPKRTGVLNNQSRSLDKERIQLEKQITELEREQSGLFDLLADTATYENREHAQKLIGRQKEVEKLLGEKLGRWEEICNLLSYS